MSAKALCNLATLTCCGREDLEALPKGRTLLQHTVIQDDELVARPGLWHSRAQVIEGKYELQPSKSDFDQHTHQHATSDGKDLFWCDKTWDPSTGQLLNHGPKPLHNRKSCSLSSRFVLA